jgi:predicted flap endonuclease-1-like 5' DNA nuclease
MTYKIIDIQGIGPVYAEKLIAIGIETVDQLLEKGADAKGRQAIEEATGIRHDLVLTWVNHAALFRVKGIGPQFAELLEAAGVDTVKELRNRNAANLAAKMAEVNEEKHLTRRTPVEKEIQKFIDIAKELEPKVTH